MKLVHQRRSVWATTRVQILTKRCLSFSVPSVVFVIGSIRTDVDKYYSTNINRLRAADAVINIVSMCKAGNVGGRS